MPRVDFIGLTEYFQNRETGKLSHAGVRAGLFYERLPQQQREELAQLFAQH